jgi:hypothetical protein
MIRLYSKEIGESLKNTLLQSGEARQPEVELGKEFSESAEAKLDDIFQDKY